MPEPRPKAYRPYRAAVYVTYVVIVVFLTSLPFLGVIRGLVAEARVEAPERPPIVVATEPGAPLSKKDARACLEAFEQLRHEINARFAELGSLAAREGREALRTWMEASRLWEATLASVAEECRIEDPAGGPRAELLEPVASSLERAARAYSGHATRLVIEDASVFEELEQSFSTAREKLGRMRLGAEASPPRMRHDAGEG